MPLGLEEEREKGEGGAYIYDQEDRCKETGTNRRPERAVIRPTDPRQGTANPGLRGLGTVEKIK